MATHSEKDAARKWENIWKKADVETWKWDNVSETIYQVLSNGANVKKATHILEAGSGTGRISFKLSAENQVDVLLIDLSKTAIRMSKKIFKEEGKDGFFILASIFRTPIRDNSIDIVWNAGVLEHLSDGQKNSVLKEMTRTCKRNGLIITINPYSKAVFYRVGKWVAEKRHRWIYGYEKPIRSMTKYKVENCIWKTEFSTDFKTSINFLLSIPYFRFVIPLIYRLSKRIPTYISNNFGYLLISIASKT